MSELIDRLIARTDSDLRRGITFADGMRHFTELVRTTMLEMDAKLTRMEELLARVDKRK